MAVMWWWSIPIGATLLAWFGVLWRTRSSVHRDPVVTVQKLKRFRGAMTRVHEGENVEQIRGATSHSQQHRVDEQTANGEGR